MKPVVLDASALGGLLLDAGRVGTWIGRRVAARHLAAPELAVYETANVLRRRATAGAVSQGEASLAHEDLLALRVELWPYHVDSERIWELRGSVTVYDAAYVAVAERIGADLVTLDARLARASGPTCPVVLPDL